MCECKFNGGNYKKLNKLMHTIYSTRCTEVDKRAGNQFMSYSPHCTIKTERAKRRAKKIRKGGRVVSARACPTTFYTTIIRLQDRMSMRLLFG